jgi:hypothetical protein
MKDLSGVVYSMKSPYELGNELPETKDAKCLGEQCPNWNGFASCSASEKLIVTDAKTKKDGSLNPHKASFAIYGTICVGGEFPKIVSQRLEVLKPMVNMMLVQEFASWEGAPLVVDSRPSFNLRTEEQ